MAGREVELDFLGVDALTEPFLEAGSAGSSTDSRSTTSCSRMIVSNMTVRDVQGLRFVLERARQRRSGTAPSDPAPTGAPPENP